MLKASKSANGPKASQNRSQSKGKATLEDCYREGGGYWATVQALRSLGVGRLHALKTIVPAVRKAMGSNFKVFAAKKGAMSADERIIMNVATVARDDYGKPLRKVGYEVRYDGREKVAGLFRLKVGK